MTTICFPINLASILHPIYEDENVNGYKNDSVLLAEMLRSKYFVKSNVLVVGTNSDIVLKRWDYEATFREEFCRLAKCTTTTDPKSAMNLMLKQVCHRSIRLQPDDSPFRKRARGSMLYLSFVNSLAVGQHQSDLLHLLSDWTRANDLQHFKLKKSTEKYQFDELVLAPYDRKITTMLCVRKKVGFLMAVPKDVWRLIFQRVRDDYYERMKNPQLIK